MKEFLSREQVAFEARNVDEDERAYDDLLALGFRSVPVTVFGAKAVRGFNPVELRDALAEWRRQA